MFGEVRVNLDGVKECWEGRERSLDLIKGCLGSRIKLRNCGDDKEENVKNCWGSEEKVVYREALLRKWKKTWLL